MGSKLPWRKFYYKDFTVDTQVLSVEACGAWIRILAYMNRDDDPVGVEVYSVEKWGKIIGADVEATSRILTELGKLNVADVSNGCDMSQNVTKCHSDVTVMSRRLSREHKERNSNRLRKQKQRQSQQSHESVTPLEQKKNRTEEESTIFD